jgi:asparagine synthase (glutamine-hydrolysing)
LSLVPLCGELRLDGRDDLIRALGLDAEKARAASDLDLASGAFARWGDRAPDRLLGDFAFAIRDTRDGSVFAARDPMGVKPLYYRITGEHIAVATSCAGIAALDGAALVPDPQRIGDVLVPELEAGDFESTPFSGVKRLPPAHRLRFRDGRATIAPYWKPDAARELALSNDLAYVEAFRDAFGEAVRCRLTGGTGSMLSGGLDSSAIAAFASRAFAASGGGPLATYSAVSDDPACEETASVRAVLAEEGFDPVFVCLGDVASFGREIAAFWSAMEDPFDASMVLPLLVYAAAARNGVRSVLDGLDGDCVASLEPSYLDVLLVKGAWGTAAREARGLARFYRGTYPPWASAPRLLLGGAGRAAAPGVARALSQRLRRAGRLAEALQDSVVGADLVREARIQERLLSLWQLRVAPHASLRERHAIEVTHPGIAAALERFHRVARSQGIEARHPFLDRRVVELGLSLPWDQKVRDGWSKHIVRRACEGLLPASVAWRRGRWVRLGPAFFAAAIETMQSLVIREAHDGFRELAPYVDRPRLLRLWNGSRQPGRPEDAETLWRMAALNSWLRRCRERVYDPPRRVNGPAALARVPAAGRRDSFLQEN